MRKRMIGLILFIAVFVFYRYLPETQVFDMPQIGTIVLLGLCIILWFTEFVPLGVSAVLILTLPPVLGVCSFREMLTAFPNPIIFFVIATFALSAALNKVPLAKRILLLLLKYMGGSVHFFTLAVMSATFLVSSVMSNVPATAMFIPICISLLELYDKEEDKRKTGRVLMIGLALSGMVGGIITPAGSSNNLISLSLLEEHTGVTVRFLDWIAICAPIALIILPISWLILIAIFKPVPIDKDRVAAFIGELQVLPKPDRKEIAVSVIGVGMIVLWILSTWFPAFDTTIVAIVGMAAMFLPGIDIFSWKEFSREVSWVAVLMTGTVLCVGNVVIKNGIAQLLSDTLFRTTSGASAFTLVLQLALFICVMQIIIPNGPAVIATCAPPVLLAAVNAGINPAILSIALSILSSWTIIIPLSAVPMITYSTGYYKITDIGKVGVPVLAIVSILLAVWLPFITRIIL